MTDEWMRQAGEAARLAVGLSDPNPRVGCVLVGAQGQRLGVGHTQQAGGPHAEVMALRDAARQGVDVHGATAYVTLEPCAHHGRTPPCADALVKAGLARVVVALADPNPLVGGQGVARLQAAGIEVTVLPTDHPLAVQARELNIGFLSRMVRGRPWVRVKAAVSVDGRTALPDGRSQWITGAEARDDGHAWRARATAVLTGMGTVRDDNPRLDVRALPVGRQPWRVVLDPQWRLPLDAALLAGTPGDVLVFGADGAAPERRQTLQARGVQTVPVASRPAGEDDEVSEGGEGGEGREGAVGGGRLDLGAVLRILAERGVNELHVEAGARLTGAFIQEGWADELLIYMAPKLLGPGRPLAELPGLGRLEDAVPYAWREVQQVGADVRLLARRAGADQF